MTEKKKTGGLAGITAAGIANDEKLIFLISSGFFIIGFLTVEIFSLL